MITIEVGQNIDATISMTGLDANNAEVDLFNETGALDPRVQVERHFTNPNLFSFGAVPEDDILHFDSKNVVGETDFIYTVIRKSDGGQLKQVTKHIKVIAPAPPPPQLTVKTLTFEFGGNTLNDGDAPQPAVTPAH